MYTTLAVFAAVFGLAVTGSALYTAWYAFQLQRKQGAAKSDKPAEAEGQASEASDGDGGVNAPEPSPFLKTALLRWTVFDYALLITVLIGLLFLLADLIGVMKDRDLYPYYHYGYLLTGFIFCLLGLLLLLSRLFLVLRLAGERTSLPQHHHEPNQAYQAE